MGEAELPLLFPWIGGPMHQVLFHIPYLGIPVAVLALSGSVFLYNKQRAAAGGMCVRGQNRLAEGLRVLRCRREFGRLCRSRQRQARGDPRKVRR